MLLHNCGFYRAIILCELSTQVQHSLQQSFQPRSYRLYSLIYNSILQSNTVQSIIPCFRYANTRVVYSVVIYTRVVCSIVTYKSCLLTITLHQIRLLSIDLPCSHYFLSINSYCSCTLDTNLYYSINISELSAQHQLTQGLPAHYQFISDLFAQHPHTPD